jgi:alpha-beta hydrolase superfamily lysophospholipase
MIHLSPVYVRHNGSRATRATYLVALIRESLARFCLKQLLCSYSLLYHALTRASLSLLFLTSSSYVLCQENDTISRRDLVIDLEDGLKTDAQLTSPAVGDGPFPGVVIVHGSGSTDMDGYISAEEARTDKPVRHYLLMAEYLSQRGFAVLRYNKRGVGLKGVTTNVEVVLNKTVQALERDVEKALRTLMEQDEVDKEDLTLIGSSEGAIIVPRVAVNNPNVKNIVLMGGGAHNLRDALQYQLIDRNVLMFRETDSDKDGTIKIEELEKLPPEVATAYTIGSEGEKSWKPGIDLNGDGAASIGDELEPILIRLFKYYTTAEFPTSKWYQSHFAIEATLDVIGNVPANILILHGEEDKQGPLSEILLLERKLKEAEHPDNTLITYPGLGHSFHPVNGWLQPLGPTDEKVLSDLAAWLKDPKRKNRRACGTRPPSVGALGGK